MLQLLSLLVADLLEENVKDLVEEANAYANAKSDVPAKRTTLLIFLLFFFFVRILSTLPLRSAHSFIVRFIAHCVP
jgi:hypothetical protein